MPPYSHSFPPKTLKIYISSIVFFIYIVVSLIIVGPFAPVCLLLPFPVRYWVGKQWARSMMWAAKAICGIDYVVEGIENLPVNQMAVVLCKHQSAWETIALRVFLPKHTNVLKKSLLLIPIGGWALATLHPIAIDRSKQKEALKILIELGCKRLQEGLWVVVFPEGTRMAPGTKGKFSGGGAMLAHKAQCPVVPIALNSGEFWPRNSFLKYPGTIRVKIGPAIDVGNKKAKEINAEAEEWIEQAMEGISSVKAITASVDTGSLIEN